MTEARPTVPRRRAAAPLIATIAGLVLLAACSSGTSSAHGATTASTTTGAGSPAPTAVTTTAPGVPAGAGYVALGSSFAAGPGIPTQGKTCGRSDHNYAHLVSADLHVVLTDVTCSGATTANIRTVPQGTSAPQIDAVTSTTGLVTVTIGGNDIEYSASSIACGNATAAIRCTAHLPRARIAREVAGLPAALGATIALIRDRAADARIVVVTYPRVIPAHTTCPSLGLTPADARYLGSLGDALEAALRHAAATEHVLLADPYAVPGHDACAPPADRWVAGANPPPGAFPFHPDAAGHVAMAHLVEQALRHA